MTHAVSTSPAVFVSVAHLKTIQFFVEKKRKGKEKKWTFFLYFFLCSFRSFPLFFRFLYLFFSSLNFSCLFLSFLLFFRFLPFCLLIFGLRFVLFLLFRLFLYSFVLFSLLFLLFFSFRSFLWSLLQSKLSCLIIELFDCWSIWISCHGNPSEIHRWISIRILTLIRIELINNQTTQLRFWDWTFFFCSFFFFAFLTVLRWRQFLCEEICELIFDNSLVWKYFL